MNSISRWVQAIVIVSVAALPACSIVPKGLGDYDAGYKAFGLASWYGEEFHGRPTASGEVYDQHKMTAAHRALPLGSVVRVINADNGREVEVWINDRGPFVNGRIIDLSHSAAERLGMIESGTSRVFIEVLTVGDAPVFSGAFPSIVSNDRRLVAGRLLRPESDSGSVEVWIVPGGTEARGIRWSLMVALHDERRHRRLSELIPEETPFGIAV